MQPPRVTVLFGAEVVEVDCETCTVTLRSGEIHGGDAIIGADGARGVVRRTLLQEEDVLPHKDDAPTGLALYGYVFHFRALIRLLDQSAIER